MICENCNLEKNNDEYYFRTDTNSYRSTCKECVKDARKKYREEEKDKVYESKQKYYYNNQDKCCERSREWYSNNKEIKNEKHTKYMNLRRKEDINFKIYGNIQGRLYSALYNNKKTQRTLDLISCSIEYYKSWLESQFDSNMNWDNHGSYWHIDHVKPCASFDLSNENEVKECFSWKNVRPVEKTLNLKKSDKIDEDLIIKHKVLVDLYLLK